MQAWSAPACLSVALHASDPPALLIVDVELSFDDRALLDAPDSAPALVVDLVLPVGEETSAYLFLG